VGWDGGGGGGGEWSGVGRGWWGGQTYAAAGELGELVFVETAGGGGVEREVGKGGGEEGEEEGEGRWDHGVGLVRDCATRFNLVLGVVAKESR